MCILIFITGMFCAGWLVQRIAKQYQAGKIVFAVINLILLTIIAIVNTGMMLDILALYQI